MVAVWIILILAVVQGILEWLPVSSEGQIVLILTWVNESEIALPIALFLHLGTVVAVLLKFRKDFILLFNFKLLFSKETEEKNSKKSNQIEKGKQPITPSDEQVSEQVAADQTERSNLYNIEERRKEQRMLWIFLLITTAATAVIGIPLLLLLKFALNDGDSLQIIGEAFKGGDLVTIAIGLLLIGTGIFILISRKRATTKTLKEMKLWEIIVLGIAQGFTILPGVSRSGTTMGTMLVEGVKEEEALRGSFLMSVPAVIGGNILLIAIDLIQGEASFGGIEWYVLLLAFVISAVVGFLTIDLFLRIAKKINFGWFCITLGILTIVIILITLILALTTI